MAREFGQDVGAYIMDCNMFGPARGESDEGWRGWRGDDPAFHAPVFVLTHCPRDPLPMHGGATFHIVPVLLGGGERLLENVGDAKLEPVDVVPTPTATHVKYRVVR